MTVTNLISTCGDGGDRVTLGGGDLGGHITVFRIGNPAILLRVVWLGLVLQRKHGMRTGTVASSTVAGRVDFDAVVNQREGSSAGARYRSLISSERIGI